MANTLKFKRGLVGTIPTAALGEPLFTTDTFDLYIGNGTGNTRFQKFIASGTTSQLLRGDGSLLTMPIVLTSPSNGQVLKYNGTSWVNDSDAGITGSGAAGQVAYFTGATTQSGSNNLFWDATNNRLGVGTNSPIYKLDVQGTSNTVAIRTLSNTAGDILYYATGTVTGSLNAFTSAINATGNVGASLQNNNTATGSAFLDINVPAASTGDPYLSFTTSGATNWSLGIDNSDSDKLKLGPVSNPSLAGANTLVAHTTGNISLGSTSDNGLRFQVTGDGYFSGSVGIGSTGLTDINLRIAKSLGSSVFPVSVYVDGLISSAATSAAAYFQTVASTQNLTFTLPSLYHYRAVQGTFGASSTVTNQYGYIAESTLIGATNNYGFYGNIPSGTGRWNLYMNGLADNFTAGDFYVGIPTLRTSDASIRKFILNGSQSGIGAEIVLTNETANDAASNAISFVGIRGAYGISGQIRTTRRGIMTFHTQDLQSLVSPPERMRLDASGNLGLGVTPSAWSSGQAAIQGSGWAITQTGVNNTYYIQNATYNGTNWLYRNSFAASFYLQQAGSHQFWYAPVGTAGNVVSWTQGMTLFATGNLAVGTTTDAGFRLDVNGTMRVSGNGEFISSGSENILTVRSTWSNAYLNLSRADNSSLAYLQFRTGATNNWQIGTPVGGTYLWFLEAGVERFRIANGGAATFSSSVTAGAFIPTSATAPSNGMFLAAANTLAFSTSSSEDMRLTSTGNLLLGTQTAISGASSTRFVVVHNQADWSQLIKGNTTTGSSYGLRIDAGTNALDYALYINNASNTTNFFNINGTGAATFSSSVTAGGNLLLTAGTASSVGAINLIRTGTSPVASRLTFGTDGTGYSFAIGKNQGGTVTDLLTILDSGAATFSSSIEATTAIAIGTTPDTNLPFKILKNINSTVGIRFENTSTGASSFTGYQFGTDVSGGTAFTNFLYASSGVVETGVYKPNGTALINTGSGGLNFLAVSQPIRFFTSTGNGTLRAAITNDGDFTQYNGTNPSASTTDAFRMYSADITAGNAAPHFRTENGGIIKLYQQTTGVTSATYIGGAGTGLTDSDTFDGYTIAQIVKALRNAGLLA